MPAVKQKVKALPGKALSQGNDTLTRGGGGPAVAGTLPRAVIPFFGGSIAEQLAYDRIYFVIGTAVVAFENTKVTFSGGPSVKWDVKPAPGTDGASETDQGYQPSQGPVEILIATRENFQAYLDVIAFAKVKPGKTRSQPLEVHHPDLEMYGLRNFVIVGTPFLKPAGAQMRTAVFNLLEYFEKPKKSAARETSGSHNFETIFDNKPPDKVKPGAKVHAPARPSKTDAGP